MPVLTEHGTISTVVLGVDTVRVEITPSTPERVPAGYEDRAVIGDPVAARFMVRGPGYREPEPVYMEFTGTARRFILHRARELEIELADWPGQFVTFTRDGAAQYFSIASLAVGGERIL